MSAKLEKMGAALEKARDKWERQGERVQEMEKRYAEQEKAEICDIIHAYQMTPEQLAGLLKVVGTAPPESAQVQSLTDSLRERGMTATAYNDRTEETEDDENEESFED